MTPLISYLPEEFAQFCWKTGRVVRLIAMLLESWVANCHWLSCYSDCEKELCTYQP